MEWVALGEVGIKSEIRPMIFDAPSKYRSCFKPSKKPRVFATYHVGREKDYGYFEHPQVDWLCGLPETEFNQRIKKYQGCIRLNEFDGFAESLAKSVLLGQYQWSKIPLGGDMSHTATLEQWLEGLKSKRSPNPQRRFCRKTFDESLKAVLA